MISNGAIFENVWEVNAQTDADAESLRISIDIKATVPVGEYSRGGRSRGIEAVKALDHDMRPKEKWVSRSSMDAFTEALIFTISSDSCLRSFPHETFKHQIANYQESCYIYDLFNQHLFQRKGIS